MKRGYNPGTFGHGDKYGRSDEHDASISKESLGCSEEQGGGRFVAHRAIETVVNILLGPKTKESGIIYRYRRISPINGCIVPSRLAAYTVCRQKS